MPRLTVQVDTADTLMALKRFVEAEGGQVPLLSEAGLWLSVEGLRDDAVAQLTVLGATAVRPEHQYSLEAPSADAA